jgi:hypothetical protein
MVRIPACMGYWNMVSLPGRAWRASYVAPSCRPFRGNSVLDEGQGECGGRHQGIWGHPRDCRLSGSADTGVMLLEAKMGDCEGLKSLSFLLLWPMESLKQNFEPGLVGTRSSTSLRSKLKVRYCYVLDSPAPWR